MTLDEIKAKYELKRNQSRISAYVFAARVMPYLLDIAITARRDLNARLGPGRDLQQEVPTLSDVQRALYSIEEAKL